MKIFLIETIRVKESNKDELDLEEKIILFQFNQSIESYSITKIRTDE